MRVMGPYSPNTVTPVVSPYCRSANVQGKFQLTPVKGEGW